MRTLVTILVAGALMVTLGCGNKKEAAQQAAGSVEQQNSAAPMGTAPGKAGANKAGANKGVKVKIDSMGVKVDTKDAKVKVTDMGVDVKTKDAKVKSDAMGVKVKTKDGEVKVDSMGVKAGNIKVTF